MEELRAWFGIVVLVGVKKLPSIHHYWRQSEKFLYCTVIPHVMTLGRWEAIQRCLHLKDNRIVQRDTSHAEFDRLAKSRWLLENFVLVSQKVYNLECAIIIDECIIPYKGKNCRIRQFMRDKPTRFGIKVWALTSSKSRFVTNIEVYLGARIGSSFFGLGQAVVERLLVGTEFRGHILVCDNAFSSVNLFRQLMVNGTWVTGTVRVNRVNMPHGLNEMCEATPRGGIVIRMHADRQMVALSWKDNDLVTMLSTTADSWQPGVQVFRRLKAPLEFRGGQLITPSTPIHMQYQELMHGIDVTDQLCGTYSTQQSSHKWWKKLLLFVLDQSLVNTWILYQEQIEELGLKLCSHVHFNIGVGKYLIEPRLKASRLARARLAVGGNNPRTSSGPQRSSLRRQCSVCTKVQTWYCTGCD